MKNPWGVLGLVFAGYVLLWPIMDAILVTFGQICNFRKLFQLSHFNFYFYELTHSLLNEEHVTFHLQYNKVCLLPTILAQIQNNIL